MECAAFSFYNIAIVFEKFGNPPAFIPQTPFCGRENSAEVLPNPFPQKIVLAKPSPHLNSVSFSPRRNPTSLSPPPYRKNKKEIAPNQNRMRGGEARAERRSGNGAEHLAVFGGVDATA